MTAQAPRLRRALISVSDQTGVVEFAQALAGAGVEILSTGGTAAALKAAGIPVKDVAEHTGFPEMMDGRLKTLHPKVHGGLLQVRGNTEHEASARQHGIGAIDLLVVNLYPFEETIAKGADAATAIDRSSGTARLSRRSQQPSGAAAKTKPRSASTTSNRARRCPASCPAPAAAPD